MRLILVMMVLTVFIPCLTWAQPIKNPNDLLEHLNGEWVLEGTIDGRQTTHDVIASWVLNRQYIQLQEVSREKDKTGCPEYEALVYITWELDRGEYSCLWLDSTGNTGLSGDAVGHAKLSGDEIPFLFFVGDGRAFHTTFIYDRSKDMWRWTMDGEDGDQLVPFARVTLERK